MLELGSINLSISIAGRITEFLENLYKLSHETKSIGNPAFYLVGSRIESRRADRVFSIVCGRDHDPHSELHYSQYVSVSITMGRREQNLHTGLP
jgi:hypothetical protein